MEMIGRQSIDLIGGNDELVLIGGPLNVRHDRRCISADPLTKTCRNIDRFRSSMRNLLDESSIAQSLDGNRLMGSLHFPAQVSRLGAAHTQQAKFAESRLTYLCDPLLYPDGNRQLETVGTSFRVIIGFIWCFLAAACVASR
jgi:hypothetical protein